MQAAPTLPFKERFTLEERKHKFGLLWEQMPDRVHLIVEPAPGSRLAFLEKCHYPCPPNFTSGHLLKTIQEKIAPASPEQALFLFVGNTTPPLSVVIGDLYAKHRDEDGFLYISYDTEPTFG